ncbi:MAG TPA: ATP-binding protein [Pirellulales bacterium]|nr:ATP-binding protein [Pirellulales bacterium]
MPRKLSTRIFVSIVGVLVLALLSSGASLLTAWKIGNLLQGTAEENLPGMRVAGELEAALLGQQGWVSSYILEPGNRAWLDQLEARKAAFKNWSTRARAIAHTKREREILQQLEQVYEQHDAKRREVIRMFDEGQVDLARRVLLTDVSRLHDEASRLCKEFIAANMQSVEEADARARRRIRADTWMVAGCAALTLGLGTALFWQFVHGVLRPLRRMVAEAESFAHDDGSAVRIHDDELRAVGAYLRLLMSDVADARTTLRDSRNRLLQAEKLATVGKLAASVAHEIRNPLTSLKMWLFWIRSAVPTRGDVDQAFDVVAAEIARLENVVRNFLDFSRPAEPRPRPCDLIELIDTTLQWIGHRIEQQQVRLRRDDADHLPAVMADPDQLRQVLVNLLDNALEVTSPGGELAVSASVETDKVGQTMVVARVCDSGPGVSDEIAERIFEPFFTTKTHGTGLGLCIAANIMVLHNGRLTLERSTTPGACFAVWVPIAGEATR